MYLSTFSIDLLNQVFHCISISLAWIGMLLSVYASVSVR